MTAAARPASAEPPPSSAADTQFEEAVRASLSASVVSRPRLGRLVSGAIGLLLLAWFLDRAARNEALAWDIFGRYFASSQVVKGLLTTIWLTAAVMAMSLILGAVVAVMRLSDNPVLQALAWIYVWVFRSTPLLVQLLVAFNIGYLVPELSIGLPFGPSVGHVAAVKLISATVAALIGLTLHTTAYASEIIRGGIQSVPAGQLEAAWVLALSPGRVFVRIVLPQAMRSILPSMGNLLVDTLKSTSIVSVLAVPDLLYATQLIYNRNFQVIPLLMVATVWYTLVTSALSVVQFYVERRFSRGANRQQPPTPIQRLRTAFARRRPAAGSASSFQPQVVQK
ncbi:amino acid ABC transporter permease [Streptomyces sp. NBC_00365]|uniref:amino acid ABC transporter permease n=1 Tax=Streptomyces sp. NBC_00365 TaxID=2975726 RepID=UPI0022593A7A|nr:amino acid ABC transporter permease [Streptomyces sp. NBC_00365]MCX5096927.1 amino acid ABC transporter permease [Streptomyces sp. NBC_00365]